MNPRRVVIFDFDGTLADSAPVIREIYGEMAQKNRWTVMSDEQYENLRKGSFAAARKWAGIRFWQLPLLLRVTTRLMSQESHNLKLFPGIIELIKELKVADIEVYVLSRNASHTIRHVLKRYELDKDIVVIDRHFMNFGNKGKAIERLLSRKRYNKNDVWMVGDEVRDLRAAAFAGVNSVAVGWGFQHPQVLRSFNPTAEAGSVEELRDILLKDIN